MPCIINYYELATLLKLGEHRLGKKEVGQGKGKGKMCLLGTTLLFKDVPKVPSI